MTHTRRFWRRRRWKALVVLVAFVVSLVLLERLLRTAQGLGSWLGAAWSDADLSQRLQLLGLVVGSGLTLALVITSALYVALTRATVRELVDARRAAKRPMFFVHLTPLQVVSRTHEPDLMLLQLVVRITNLANVPALRLTASVTLPRRPPSNQKKDWLDDAIVAYLTELPPLLMPAQDVSEEVSFPVDRFIIPEGRILEFAEIRLKFEDVERNLYESHQRYNLSRYGASPKYYWSLYYESLSMLPWSKRQFVDDVRLGVRNSDDERNTTVVYERVSML